MSNNNNTTEIKPPYAEEIALIKQYVNSESVVLDIGANIGSFTVFLAGIARQVYAFEPEPNNYDELMHNTRNLDNVRSFDVAISDELGLKTLYTCPQDNGMHRLYPSKWCKEGKQIEVMGGTVDHFVRWLLIKSQLRPPYKISFIKIDVEGWEYHVIKGAVNTIKRDHPVIMMEWHPPSLEEAGTNPREFYDFMIKELGYNKPDHMLLPYAKSMSYEELDNYTVNTPAINILWT